MSAYPYGHVGHFGVLPKCLTKQQLWGFNFFAKTAPAENYSKIICEMKVVIIITQFAYCGVIHPVEAIRLFGSLFDDCSLCPAT